MDYEHSTSTRAVEFAGRSPDAVACVSPPGVDNQDGGSGRRGRLRGDAGVSLCLCAGSPVGYAPLAATWRVDGSDVRVRDRAVAAASLDLATAPLGATRPIAHREAPPSRRPVAGHHRTGSQQGRAGAVAGPLRSGGSLRRPRRSEMQPRRRGAQFAPSRLGGAGRGLWRRRPSASAWRFPPRPSMPGSDFSRLGAGRLGTRSPPSNRCPRKSSFPTASLSEVTVQLAAGSLWHPPQGWAQLGAQPPVLSSLEDGCYRFELPGQIAEGWLQREYRRCPAGRADQADAASRADGDRRRGDAARLSRAAPPSYQRRARRRDRVGQGKSRAVHGHRQPQALRRQRGRPAANARRGRDREPDERRRQPEQDRIPVARRVQPGGQGAAGAHDHALRRRSPRAGL